MIINDAAKEQVPDLSITTNSLGKSPIHQRHSDADVAAAPATVGCRVICFAHKLRLSITDGSFRQRRPFVLGHFWVRPQLLMVCLHVFVLDAF